MEPRKDIIEAIKEGKTIKEVSKITGASPATVSLHKRMAGLSKSVKKRAPRATPLPVKSNGFTYSDRNVEILRAAITLLKQIQ